jgi:bacterioferritin-associated ferredoxin
MAPVFIFAEQVRSIVRSGKTEIEIPEGAQLSSAAVDLIKEHQIRVKTIAPGGPSDEETSKTGVKSAVPASKGDRKKRDTLSAEKPASYSHLEKPAEISESELEEIVNRVIERVQKLKGNRTSPAASAGTAVDPGKEGTPTSDDDLVICRCEEITRGEIKEAIRNGMRTLNGIKRVTRAGMGLCQGQTCQLLVARILTEELGLDAAEIDPTTARGPVRPLRLEVFANS